jgi:hypothetical protein
MMLEDKSLVVILEREIRCIEHKGHGCEIVIGIWVWTAKFSETGGEVNSYRSKVLLLVCKDDASFGPRDQGSMLQAVMSSSLTRQLRHSEHG